MIHKIHQTEAEKQTSLSENHFSEIQKHGKKLDDVKNSIDELHETQKDKSTETLGFTGIITNLQESVRVIDSLKKDINNPDKVVRKLDEVKSATLITNKLLKDIVKKEVSVDVKLPTEMKMELTNKSNDLAILFFSMLKGEKGDSRTEEELLSLIKPLIPKPIKGEKGEKGEKGNSMIGQKGDKGKDGSPDTSDEIIAKLNSSKMMIDSERIKGLVDLINQIEEYGKYPLGGGGNSSTGITVKTPSESPDSDRTVFTVEKTPKWVVVDGITYYDGFGYTAGAGIITMTNPPNQGGYIRYYV